MQKGFAMLEVILFMAVTAILATIAVLKIPQVLDKVYLDYETKRFYSEVRFVQAANRSARFDEEIFSQNFNGVSYDNIILSIAPNQKSYSVKRGTSSIRKIHRLQKNMTISYDPGLQSIYFSPDGTHSKSGHVTLKTQRGTAVNIYFDSVGRWRGLWEIH